MKLYYIRESGRTEFADGSVYPEPPSAYTLLELKVKKETPKRYYLEEGQSPYNLNPWTYINKSSPHFFLTPEEAMEWFREIHTGRLERLNEEVSRAEARVKWCQQDIEAFEEWSALQRRQP